MTSTKKKSKEKSTKTKTAITKKVKTASRSRKAATTTPPKRGAKKKATKKTTEARVARKSLSTGGRRQFGSARQRPDSFSDIQSGDAQGLSRSEQADSESVDELVDEGNAFEAGVVAGVEEADNADEQEVHTHEVPEDDVPEEYLDEE
jgi:hypothetical protein